MKEGRSVGSSDPKKLKICFAALRAAGRSVGRTESGSPKSEKLGRSAGTFSLLSTSHRPCINTGFEQVFTRINTDSGEVFIQVCVNTPNGV